MDRPLPVGRVSGFRGLGGELTVKVASGEAGRWTRLTAVIVGTPDGVAGDEPMRIEVERSRAYRDRLVLKLRGVDDPTGANALRGRWVFAPADQVPALPNGVYWVDRLIGLEVVNERGEGLGRVEDVAPTGGVDLLVVGRPGGGELLVPLAESIILEVGEAAGRLVVRLPEGLDPEGPGAGERR